MRNTDHYGHHMFYASNIDVKTTEDCREIFAAYVGEQASYFPPLIFAH